MQAQACQGATDRRGLTVLQGGGLIDVTLAAYLFSKAAANYYAGLVCNRCLDNDARSIVHHDLSIYT